MPSDKILSLHRNFHVRFQGKSFAAERLEPILNALCHRLQIMGLKPGGVLASAASYSWLNTLLLFALPRMGCMFFPFDPALPESKREKLLSAAGAQLVLFDDHCLDQLELLPETARPGQPLPPDAVRILLATSGTQGAPRLVELTEKNLLGSVLASCRRLELTPADVWLASLPLHHIGGLSILLRCAQVGAEVVLMERFNPIDMFDALARYRATHLSLVPAMLVRLIETDPQFHPPASLRVVLLGGAAADAALVEAALRQRWPVCPSYGLTETASQVATLYPPPQKWIPGCAGFPLEHVEISICPETHAIRVRGASVATHARREDGRRTELTDEQGWLMTGDAGWLDDLGQLHITGRRDDVLITGGENIHPRMLEQELQHCPGIEDVAVSAIRDSVWGDALVALYVGAANPDQVQAWARRNLQGAFLPKRYFKTNSLPRNALGKLLRGEVKGRLQALNG